MRSGRTGRLGSDQRTSCASDILSTMSISFTLTLTLAHTLPTFIMFKFQSGINPSTLTVEDVRWRGSVPAVQSFIPRCEKTVEDQLATVNAEKCCAAGAALSMSGRIYMCRKVPSRFLQKVADVRRVLSTNKRVDQHNNVAFYVDAPQNNIQHRCGFEILYSERSTSLIARK